MIPRNYGNCYRMALRTRKRGIGLTFHYETALISDHGSQTQPGFYTGASQQLLPPDDAMQSTWPVSPTIFTARGGCGAAQRYGGCGRPPVKPSARRSMKHSSPGFSLACPVTRFGSLPAPGGTWSSASFAAANAFRVSVPPRGRPPKKQTGGAWEPGPLPPQRAQIARRGPRYLAQASPMGDPANPGIHQRRLHHESHYAYRIPRAGRQRPHCQ